MKLDKNSPISLKSDYTRRRSSSQRKALKDKKRDKHQTTEQAESVYFLWFLSLKLLLEMEEKGLSFKTGQGKSRKEYLVGKDIKLDKGFYSDWDLEEVLEKPFWKWWKSHKKMFEIPSTTISDSTKGWTSQPHYRFIRVDLRSSYSSTIKQIQKGLNDLEKGKSQNDLLKYSVLGEIRYHQEILKYNLMVRTLNEEEDTEIFDRELNRFKELRQGEDSSDLWRSYNLYMSRPAEERIPSKLSVFKSEDSFAITKKGTYRRTANTLGYQYGKQFHSALRTVIKRHIKDYQKVLFGVAQGVYRKPMKIEF